MQWGQLWLGQQVRHTDAFELVHWTHLLGHLTTWEESIFYPDLHPFQPFLGAHHLSKHSVMTKNAVPQKKKAMSHEWQFWGKWKWLLWWQSLCNIPRLHGAGMQQPLHDSTVHRRGHYSEINWVHSLHGCTHIPTPQPPRVEKQPGLIYFPVTKNDSSIAEKGNNQVPSRHRTRNTFFLLGHQDKTIACGGKAEDGRTGAAKVS